MTQPKTILLIDADTTAYLAAVRSDDDGEPYTLPQVHASVDNTTEWLKKHLFAHDVINILSDRKENFRKTVYPDYKLCRKDTPRPPMLDPAKDYLLEKHGAIWWPGLEADDVQGIIATSGSEDVHYIVVSIDKDLKQIPGSHFNPRKAGEGVTTVTPEAGLLWMWEQTLSGDATDGYPGIPGVGPVKAKAILKAGLDAGLPVENLWHVVLAAYLKAGLTQEYALSQLRCARILQAQDWDLLEDKVLLYVPKGYSK